MRHYIHTSVLTNPGGILYPWVCLNTFHSFNILRPTKIIWTVLNQHISLTVRRMIWKPLGKDSGAFLLAYHTPKHCGLKKPIYSQATCYWVENSWNPFPQQGRPSDTDQVSQGLTVLVSMAQLLLSIAKNWVLLWAKWANWEGKWIPSTAGALGLWKARGW